MKKFFLLLSCLMLLCCGGCGNAFAPEVTQVPSDIYTDAEITAAIDAAKNYFRREFSGCTLTKISYGGDEVSAAHEEWAQRHDADQVLVLTSSFDVGASGGDGSLNPNSTYTGWMWIMVREDGGPWRHADHGY